jgi:hypothetical protein
MSIFADTVFRKCAESDFCSFVVFLRKRHATKAPMNRPNSSPPPPEAMAMYGLINGQHWRRD